MKASSSSASVAHSRLAVLNPFKAYLAQHADYGIAPETATSQHLSDWLVEADNSSRMGARAAYLIGRVLRARRPKHGKVAEWVAEEATRLQRRPRTVRLYMQVASAIDDALATPLPISILDRPLRELPAAINAVRAGRDPDAKRKRKPERLSNFQQWRGRAKNLLGSIPRPTNRKDLLQAHLLAVYHQLLKLDPSLAPLAASGQDDGATFAIAVAAQLQKDKPLPSCVLKARRKVPPVIPYPGGKSRVVDTLLDAIGVLQADGCYGDYVFREPFVGGGSVMLNMLARGQAKRVWINDVEPGVVAVYNAIIHEHEQFAVQISELPAKPTKEFVEDLYAEVEYGQISGLDLAVAELLLRACTMDADRRSYSAHKVQRQWRPRRVATRIGCTHQLLAGRVEHGECTLLDAAEVITAPGPCFTYADPPYVDAGPAKYPQPLSEKMHRHLAAALGATDQPWLLSYDDHPLVRELYAAEVIEPIEVRGSRGRKAELLICPASLAGILRPDMEPNYIEELFGVECEAE